MGYSEDSGGYGYDTGGYDINLGGGQINPDAPSSHKLEVSVSSVPFGPPPWILDQYKWTPEKVRANSPWAPPPPPFNVHSLLRWGKAANYATGPNTGGGFIVKKSNNPEKDNEISRETQTYRVHNPDDDQQWVDVERIKSITFQGSDGMRRVYTLKDSP